MGWLLRLFARPADGETWWPESGLTKLAGNMFACPPFTPVLHLIAQMTLLTWREWIATCLIPFSPSACKINIPRIGAWGMSHSFRATTNLTL